MSVSKTSNRLTHISFLIIFCLTFLGCAYGYSGFPDSRVLTFPSPTSPGEGIFEIFFSHRFSQPLDDSSLNDLFGLDSFAYTGFGLGYGVSSRWSVRIYRTMFEKNFELSSRYVIYENDWLDIVPRITWNWNTDSNTNDPLRVGVQAIIGLRKGRVSLALAPSWVLNPSRTPSTQTSTLGLPLQFGIELSQTFSLAGEIAPVLAGYRIKTPSGSFSPTWGIGIHITIGEGGHVFSLLLTNQIGTTLDQTLPGSSSSKLRIGFNLLRRI